jgi:hypothetical protein
MTDPFHEVDAESQCNSRVPLPRESRGLLPWKLLSSLATCALLLTLLAALLIGLMFLFSFLISGERLLASIDHTPVNSVHFILDGGQLLIGTQTDIPELSDWVRQVRSGTAWFGSPVAGSFDFNVGALQLSWITFNGQPPTFGFACPLLAMLIPAAIAGWCFNAVRRHAERRRFTDVERLAATDTKPTRPNPAYRGM